MDDFQWLRRIYIIFAGIFVMLLQQLIFVQVLYSSVTKRARVARHHCTVILDDIEDNEEVCLYFYSQSAATLPEQGVLPTSLDCAQSAACTDARCCQRSLRHQLLHQGDKLDH